MIKAKATGPANRPLYIFGLSAGNIVNLQAGHAIDIQLEPMGGVGSVLITYGHTEADIAKSLAEFIGPDTQVTGERPN